MLVFILRYTLGDWVYIISSPVDEKAGDAADGEKAQPINVALGFLDTGGERKQYIVPRIVFPRICGALPCTVV